MTNHPVTLIVSDLHVGGGAADPGDDHIYHKNQLVGYLRDAAASKEGQAGRLELFFNGDFLEFAQTDTDAFKLLHENAWCTKDESLKKLNTIIAGHPDIFQALADFQTPGNQVTIAAGNHDVDLYWELVQDRLREVAGPKLKFELGQEWVERHGGKLQIGHGHMHDVANRFKNWKHPFATLPYGVERLEMCPGTLFMVKFVNQMEAEYPFADNLLPVGKLAAVLMKDDKSGFMSVAWAFSKFLSTTSFSTLGANSDDDFGRRLVAHISYNPARLALLKEKAAEFELPPPDMPLTEEWLASNMFSLLGRISAKDWAQLFEVPGSATLGDGSNVSLSALSIAKDIDGREELRKAARLRAAETQASVIVMGHTHQPDRIDLDNCVYYNPGSWTRYLDLRGTTTKVTLEDLRNEAAYPYQLNVVRVENVNGSLQSAMIKIDSQP
jgi:UDP-2,3-diacylglucosamine pyrophosphatase LpxH